MKKISDYYGIDPKKLEKLDVFDAILGTDNPYFIDPVMLEGSIVKEFEASIVDLRRHFKTVISLLKLKTKRGREEAKKLIQQEELKGLSTGYGSRDDGSGVGPVLAEKLITTAEELIDIKTDSCYI